MDASGYGMIVQAAGSALQAYAAWKDQMATAQAIKDELVRQGKFQGQEFTMFENALPGQGMESAQQQIGQGQAQREQDYGQLYNVPIGKVAGMGASATDRGYSSGTGAAKAKLGGYGDWSLQQTIDRQRVAQEMAVVADKSHQYAQLFPTELYTAGHRWDEMSAAGSMLAGLGNANLSQYYSSPTGGGTAGGGGQPMAPYSYNSQGYAYPNYQPNTQGAGDYYVMPQINNQGEEINLPQYA